jgi:Lytic transglycolase
MWPSGGRQDLRGGVQLPSVVGPELSTWLSTAHLSPEKGGALRTQSTVGRRACAAAVFSAALLALPLLLLNGGPGPALASASASIATAPAWQLTYSRSAGTTVPAAAPSTAAPVPAAVSPTTSAPVTTTTAQPVHAQVQPAAAVVVPTPTTTTPPRPTTTTTAPPKATTTTAPPVVANVAVGQATWYAEAPSGTCASPSLAFGTMLHVRDNDTGTVITCVVADREANNPGRVVDLSVSGFSALADTSQGVISVTITW